MDKNDKKEVETFDEISSNCEYVMSHTNSHTNSHKICSHPYYYNKKMAVPCNEGNCKMRDKLK